MLDNITPGTRVTLKVTKAPTSQAARKTLIKLLSKSDQVRARNKHLAKVRRSKYSPSMRGGRLYSGRMIKLPAVSAQVGTTQTVTATLDVLRELPSVSRFLQIGKA